MRGQTIAEFLQEAKERNQKLLAEYYGDTPGSSTLYYEKVVEKAA